MFNTLWGIKHPHMKLKGVDELTRSYQQQKAGAEHQLHLHALSGQTNAEQSQLSKSTVISIPIACLPLPTPATTVI
jgi:hypothetical protein